jgi:hypothetical protein
MPPSSGTDESAIDEDTGDSCFFPFDRKRPRILPVVPAPSVGSASEPVASRPEASGDPVAGMTQTCRVMQPPFTVCPAWFAPTPLDVNNTHAT